ncbi:TniQ family protein [Methylobacterium goesingense]|uniref:TniQ domain-containing protein n=1 Tax=Methylobacterium goesingense TaxID=243690 RepID=A0ABV2LDD9_9HYPH|nr:TniQ family protein [Methylobacterium goesingense]GJD76712.1 hypothetical protein CFIICLFH_4971 [Methylobacterium goesingense]
MTGTPLTLTIPLMPGESTPGFLSRLAARNGIPHMRHFCADIGLARGPILYGEPSELARLAQVSAVPAVALEAASLRKVPGGFSIRGHRIPPSSLRRKDFHVCPACLRADIAESSFPNHVAAYDRLIWKVRTIRTCPIHELGLVDLGAGDFVADQDFTAVMCPYMGRLDALERDADRRPTSELERYVLTRLDGHLGNAPFLDALEVHVAARFCEVIGALSIHGRGLFFERLDEGDWHLAGAAGIAIAGLGGTGIRAFLNELQRAYPYGRSVSASPRSPMGDLRSWLARHKRDASYDVLQNLIGDILDAGPPADVVDKPRRVHTGHWITLPGTVASLDLQGAPSRRRRLLPTAPLIEIDAMKHHKATLAPPISSLSATEASPGLDQHEAMDRLDCGMPLFQSLVAHGFVRPAQPTARGGWRHAFEPVELDAFISRLLAAAAPVQEFPADMVGIAEAAIEGACTEVEVIHLLLGQRLAMVGRKSGEDGIRSILVSSSEVAALVSEHTFLGPTLPEARAELKVKPGALLKLIELGILVIERAVDAASRRAVKVISKRSFHGFSDNYASECSLICYSDPNPYSRIDCLKKSGAKIIRLDRSGNIGTFIKITP